MRALKSAKSKGAHRERVRAQEQSVKCSASSKERSSKGRERKRRRHFIWPAATLAPLTFSSVALAQEAVELPVVTVTAPRDGKGKSVPGALTDAASSQSNPKSTVTPEGIKILGGPAQANYYKTLDLMPSVIEDSADPYGLSFNRQITIRGVTSSFVALTYDGLPLAGIIPGGDLFDLENVAGIDLYRGTLQANQGLGFSNAAGALDIRLLPPQEHFGGQISQGFGSDSFHRTFARIDSGLLPTGTAFFVSGSIAAADKWKGAGGAERDNVEAGISQSFGDRVDVKVYMSHNDQKANDYLALTYAQVQQLGAHPYQDFNTRLTGNPAVDANYYGFNTEKFTNTAVFSEVVLHLAPGQTLTLKPYFWEEDGYKSFTVGSGVRLWSIKPHNLGGVVEYDGHFDWGGELLVGYWQQATNPAPPVVDQKQFTVTPQGGLTFSNWAVLSQFTDYQFHTPYLQYTQTLGATTFTGGLRAQIGTIPDKQYYQTAGLPNLPYDQIFSLNPPVDPNAVVAGRTYTEWLPNFGIRQQLTPEWSLNASYSRKIAAPDWSSSGVFLGNEAAFLKQGLNLGSIFNNLRPAIVDEIDFGPRYQSSNLAIVPTFFGFKTHHKEILVYDPVVGLNYYQSNASTTGYGAELEVAWKPNEQLTFTGSGTAQSETYDHNIQTASNTIMAVQGKQVAYAPRYMLKGAVSYQIENLTVTPVMRYVSTRYGIADDTQAVSPYFVTDISASYDIGKKIGVSSLGLKSLIANVGVLNLFDRHYIGQMGFEEIRLSGVSYYEAPPRTVFGTLTAKF